MYISALKNNSFYRYKGGPYYNLVLIIIQSFRGIRSNVFWIF